MKVSQMEYKRVDIVTACEQIDALIKEFNASQTAQEQLLVDEKICKLMEEIETAISLSLISPSMLSYVNGSPFLNVVPSIVPVILKASTYSYS